MASLFTRIINREIPAYIIAEDDHCLAFLDIFPLTEGHTLVIPKKEVDYLFDVDDELLSHMIVFSKKISHAMKKSVSCKRIGVAVVGLEVPHAHIHLIPLQSVSDIDFSRPKLKLTEKQMEEIREKIIKNI